MAAEHLNWYDYDRERIVECGCGWSGRSRDEENYFREVLDVTCPKCDTMLLIVAYPTHDETRAAAAAGNQDAIRTLPQVESRVEFLESAAASELKEPEQLPDLEGDEIIIEWDFEDREQLKEPLWTVLRHKGQEIFREHAYWEGIYRFEEVLWILREKYGPRLVELRPTDSSQLYLLGDYLWAAGKVTSLNSELRDYREAVWDPESYVDVEDEESVPDDQERLKRELHAAIKQIVDVRCSVCDWTGDANEARAIDRGRYLDVGCARCRRPLFQVTPDMPE